MCFSNCEKLMFVFRHLSQVYYLSLSVVLLVFSHGYDPPDSAAIHLPGNNSERWCYRNTAGTGDSCG